MKFYNRKEEMQLLRKFRRVAILGRRRIGKTRLVEETFKNDLIKLFVNAEKSDKLNAIEWVNEVRSKGMYIPELSSMRDVVEFLLRTYREKVIFIDEIQNVLKVNKAFLYDLQKLLDESKKNKFIVTGSYLSVAKKIVENYKSPLYGRFDAIIKLNELDIWTVLEIGKDLALNAEESFILYMVFGGVPKYYETLSDIKMKPIDFIEFMFFKRPFPMQEEIRIMLKEEFGKEYRMYFSILQAIVEGHNRLGEIGGFIGVKTTDLSKYIYNLEREYELIRKLKPKFLRSRSIYEIKPNIFEFWFRYVWKYYPMEDNFKMALNDFKRTFNEYLGKRFEVVFRDTKILEKIIDDRISYVGKEFGKVSKSEVVDIDILVITESNRIILFEVKWKNLSKRDVERIKDELEEKAKRVKITDKDIRYGIIARKIEKIDDNIIQVDVNDIYKRLDSSE